MIMKFYQLSRADRLTWLKQAGYLTDESEQRLLAQTPLAEAVLSAMVENSLGEFGLPMGVADHFLIDGHEYFVPMVTEEPSVIAAASNGAKRVAASGGFQTVEVSHLLKAQVIINGVTNQVSLTKRLTDAQSAIETVIIEAHPSLQKRGGGLRQIEINHFADGYSELALWIDPVAAFGANMANTIAEAVGTYIQQALLKKDEQVLAAVLSNSGEKMTVTVTCQVDFTQLATAEFSGQQVALKIAALNHYAALDIDRAATENKGILNGIFAVGLATGNDLRAISAAVTDYLCGANRPVLSTWQLDQHAEVLRGRLTIPLPVGRVGGAINSLPNARVSLELLQHPSVETLMSIIASVGLANNLAALRALVTNGIQAGHMALQTANLAIQAGATGEEIGWVQQQLNQHQPANLALAQQLLQQFRNRG